MHPIKHSDLIDYLELDKQFKFIDNDRIFHHHLCNTLIYIKYDYDGSISYNNNIGAIKLYCSNIIAYEDADSKIFRLILLHDINKTGLPYSKEKILHDLRIIRKHLADNYPNYDKMEICAIRYISRAEKVSTLTTFCSDEKYIVKSNGIIDLQGYCIQMSTIYSNYYVSKF